MEQAVWEDMIGRLQAIEDLLTYTMARYLSDFDDEVSIAIKEDFANQPPAGLGSGLMDVDELQRIQSLIQVHKVRYLELISEHEGRPWSPTDK